MGGTLPESKDIAVNQTDQVLSLQDLSSLEGGNELRKKKLQENVRDISEIELTERDDIVQDGVDTGEDNRGRVRSDTEIFTSGRERPCLDISQNKNIDPRTLGGRVQERGRKRI